MINLKNIVKNFDNKKVIKKISFDIKAGEVVGLLGPNGAGKTTTVRMIAGVLPPTEGTILINNQNLFDENSQSKPHIGYLPENNPIYDDMTVEEFLNYWANLKKIPKDQIAEKIDQAVKSVGLQDVFYRNISELSKGFRQRTGFAQAILGDPELLLLDEPTEGLDPNQRREIHKLIQNLGKERTVIICSHVLPEITKMCDRVIIINDGKVVGDSLTKNINSMVEGKSVYELVASGKNIHKSLESLPKVVDIAEEKSPMATKYIITSESKKDLSLKIFDLAKKKGWDVYSLNKKQVDLEDIFAQLTK